MDILIGADPEFFVRSKKTNELISAHGLIAGTKQNPMPMGPGHAQVDGMALEINVPPARDAKEFIDGFNGVMDALKKELPDVVFDFSPVAHFGIDVIRDQPREARELGCEPDFSAYTGKANPRPNADTPFRTASGHVHIGWTEDQDIGDQDHIDACNMLSKQLDFFLGLPSLVWDEDVTRRDLYGKAGCYRPKRYGMEYRTLSNAWLTDPDRIAFVVEQSKIAFNQLVAQANFGNRNTAGYINTGDWKKAYNYYHDYFNLPKWANLIYKARVAKENEDLIKNAPVIAKGDVAGKGFPANHLAKVAWGRKQIAFDMEINAPAGIPIPPGLHQARVVNIDGNNMQWAPIKTDWANARWDNIRVANPNPELEAAIQRARAALAARDMEAAEPQLRPWAAPAPAVVFEDAILDEDNDLDFDFAHDEDEELL